MDYIQMNAQALKIFSGNGTAMAEICKPSKATCVFPPGVVENK
jgi:hypothetical protein